MKAILAQLRTSHFWLVMASVGLLILPSFPRSSVYRNAYDELSRMIAVNATITPEALTQTFGRMTLPKAAKQDPATILSSAPWHFGQVRCQKAAGDRPGFQQVQAMPAVWMTAPQEETAYPVPLQLPPAFNTPPGARTLAQFMQIWAFLENDDHAFMVTALGPQAAKNDSAFELPGIVQSAKRADQRLECFVGAFTLVQATVDRANPQIAWLTVNGMMETDLVNRNGLPGPGGGGDFRSQPIPVSVQPLQFPLFASHLQAYFAAHDLSMTDLAGQQFSDAFGDLAHVAKGLESLNLHDLRAYVERMTEESGTDVEIFGARLPIDILVEWGIPLLVVMQLYFWLHLTMFAARGVPSRAVRSFPWIACYPQPLARGVTVGSLALTPIAAATLLYFGAEHDTRSVWLSVSLTVATLVSIALAVLTAVALLGLSRVPAGGAMQAPGQAPAPADGAAVGLRDIHPADRFRLIRLLLELLR